MQLLGRILDPTGVFGVIDALVNVPQSTEDGVELATTWHPIDGLSLELSGTYLDARVTGNFTTYDDYTGVLTNFNGYSLPNTPKFIGIASPQYTWLLAPDLIATIGADYRYQSASESGFVSRADYLPGVQSSPGYTPGSVAISPYGVLDANASIGAADGRWSIKFWGQNVTNKYYWSDAFHVYDTTVRYAGMPATYGVTFALRFSGK
jgi:iron complex outermembrane receptor protein